MNLYDDIILTEHNPDYYVVINNTNDYFISNKTIYFQMEPVIMDTDVLSNNKLKYFITKTHQTDYNNIEWHLSLDANTLLNFHPNKTKNLSVIISNKYIDIGHRKRVDFLKFLEKKMNIDVFGSNLNYVNYKGSLPYGKKDNGLFDYKYTFNAENHSIKNYFTEKIIDAILAECVCFYWGCPNIEEWIDPCCFIKLNLDNFENDFLIIKQSIENQEWEKRIVGIRRMKVKIIKEMSFFSRVRKLVNY